MESITLAKFGQQKSGIQSEREKMLSKMKTLLKSNLSQNSHIYFL
jgi:hypothetical protein